MTPAHGLVLVLASARAFAGSEVLGRFGLKTCASRTCVAVEAAESRRSPLDAAYVFKKARVRLAEIEGDRVRTSREFEVSGGYYDPELGYLVLHGSPGGLVNLRTGRVTLLEPVVKRRTELARRLAQGHGRIGRR